MSSSMKKYSVISVRQTDKILDILHRLINYNGIKKGIIVQIIDRGFGDPKDFGSLSQKSKKLNPMEKLNRNTTQPTHCQSLEMLFLTL